MEFSKFFNANELKNEPAIKVHEICSNYLKTVTQYLFQSDNTSEDSKRIYEDLNVAFGQIWNLPQMAFQSYWKTFWLQVRICLHARFGEDSRYEFNLALWMQRLKVHSMKNPLAYLRIFNEYIKIMVSQGSTFLIMEDYQIQNIHNLISENLESSDWMAIYITKAYTWIKLCQYQKSLTILRKCLKIYRTHPKYPMMHSQETQILFFIGFIHEQLENHDLALKTYEQITTRPTTTMTELYSKCRSYISIGYLNSKMEEDAYSELESVGIVLSYFEFHPDLK